MPVNDKNMIFSWIFGWENCRQQLVSIISNDNFNWNLSYIQHRMKSTSILFLFADQNELCSSGLYKYDSPWNGTISSPSVNATSDQFDDPIASTIWVLMYGSESYLSPEPILNGLGFEMGECINCCCLCMMIVVSHEICHHNHHDMSYCPMCRMI